MIEKLFSPILYIIRHEKRTVLLSIISALIFSVLLFPYDDLSDMLTSRIFSESQVFVQFDKLGLGFFPPSLKMSNVSVEAQFLPSTLNAKALHLAPSIASLIAFSPGFSVFIEKVMNGDISLTYREGKKINKTSNLQKIAIDFSNLNLKNLFSYAGLPVEAEGLFDADINTQIDLTFVEQPDAELDLKIGKFYLPPSTIPTTLGPLTVPNETALSNIQIKGELKNAELVINEGTIGGQGETINGRFKGKIGLRINRIGNQIIPEWASYEFKIDLSFDQSAEKNFGLFLGFFDKFKTITGYGSRYAFKLSAPNINAEPASSPLGTF